METKIVLQENSRALAERNYEVLRLLGEGAFSQVLLVREGATGRRLACKVCKRKSLGQREGILLRQVDHPLFPKYYGMWQADGKVFLLLETVWGSSLEELLKRRGTFSARQTARMGLELAAGIKYLHELPESVLFRDVKPANIVVRQDGRVKLLDLGCACRRGEETKNLAGTPGYGAPEQLEQGHMLTPACDVYGLGKTLQAAAGETCNRELSGVLKACTCLRPEERIPDMQSVIRALTPFAEGEHMPKKQRFWRSRVICEKNIWESSYKNS